jgi:hypothetical protein
MVGYCYICRSFHLLAEDYTLYTTLNDIVLSQADPPSTYKLRASSTPVYGGVQFDRSNLLKELWI